MMSKVTVIERTLNHDHRRRLDDFMLPNASPSGFCTYRAEIQVENADQPSFSVEKSQLPGTAETFLGKLHTHYGYQK